MRIALLFLSLLPYAARADQCDVVSEGLKPKVMDLLQTGRRYVEWCEPCHESAAGPIKVIEQVDLAPNRALHLNDRDADLAYVFVETMPGSGRFVNAAKAVSCPAHDVSAEVNVAAEKPTVQAPARAVTPTAQHSASPGKLSAQRHSAGQP